MLLFFSFITVQVNAEETKKSEEDVNSILKEKGFSDEETDSLSKETKEKIAENDGEKAEYSIEKTDQYYNSLDGNRYKVTEENKEKIDSIRQRDLEKMNMNKPTTFSTSPHIGNDSDGKWSAETVVIKKGTTSKEYKYSVATDWFWSKTPNAYFTDTIGTAWETDWTGIGGTESSHGTAVGIYGDGPRPVDISQSVKLKQEIYGLKADFDLGTWDSQTGGFIQDVVVPKRLYGETTSMVTTYAHPYSPGKVSLDIGPGSISPEKFWGDEWTYRVNITVGK